MTTPRDECWDGSDAHLAASSAEQELLHGHRHLHRHTDARATLICVAARHNDIDDVRDNLHLHLLRRCRAARRDTSCFVTKDIHL